MTVDMFKERKLDILPMNETKVKVKNVLHAKDLDIHRVKE